MKRPIRIAPLACSLLALLAVTACAPKKAAKSGSEDAAADTSAPVGKWTYDGATGPDHWAQLGGASVTCGSGLRQSPVDITGQPKPQVSHIRLDYNSVGATIQNTGKTIVVTPQGGGGITIDGVNYALKHIEFHSPSEHAINGHRSTLESQFVHQDKAGHTVVVSVLYDIGNADPMLGSLWTYLPTDPGQPVPLADLLINAQDLMPGTEDYYVYSGSMTTPPCTEGVTWMVYSQVLSVSAEQADAFERLIGPNARPLQAQQGRDYIHLTGN